MAGPARGWLLSATLNTSRTGGTQEQPLPTLPALGPQAALGICAGSSTLDARLALVAVSIVVFLLQAVILLEDWAHAAIARHGECSPRPALHAVA